MRLTVASGSLLVLVMLVACGEASTPGLGGDVGVREATGIPSTPPDSAVLVTAQRVVRAFLDASRESTSDPIALDTLTACGEGGQSYFPTTLLAGYTLLPFETRGDTIVGRAEVVTVAEQDIDRRATNRFVARIRVRRDVLEWDVIADADGRWTVCNGLRFGYRGTDSLTTWRPEGASYASARRLADSIAAVSR
ncbi:MAG: hypothetical protein IPP90_21725 [Gemmatimonadaceae bacterium]|nr:hypothetical protein [Gemmatimonadaceae bacterium]